MRSTNPDFDIYQWQANQHVSENAFSLRLDAKISSNWSMCGRVFHDQAESHDPQDASGRFFKATLNPTNGIFNLQGILGNMINEFKFGYNGAPSTEGADTQAGFENIADQPRRQRRQRGYRRPGIGLVARRARRPGSREQRGQRPRRAAQPVLR